LAGVLPGFVVRVQEIGSDDVCEWPYSWVAVALMMRQTRLAQWWASGRLID
jgi:hypothetical protein